MAKSWEKVEVKYVNGKATLVPVAEEKSAKAPQKNIYKKAQVKSLSLIDLKKEGDKAFLEKMEREDALVEKYNNKQLKSKDAIAAAKEVIKRREKEAEKAGKKDAVVA